MSAECEDTVYNESKSKQLIFTKSVSHNTTKVPTYLAATSVKRPINQLTRFLREAFLPAGYPESVSDDYLAYQTWDTIQAFASSISGSLATHAVLEGVGVGDGNATSLAATITWLLRQGAGMVGQILFTWIQGSDLGTIQ